MEYFSTLKSGSTSTSAVRAYRAARAFKLKWQSACTGWSCCARTCFVLLLHVAPPHAGRRRSTFDCILREKSGVFSWGSGWRRQHTAVTPGMGGTRQLRQHAFTFITFTFTFAFKIYISGIQHLHLTRWVRVRVRVRVKVSFLAQQSSGSTPTSTGASEGVDTEPKDNPSLTLARVHSSAEGKQTELGLCGDCE